MDNFMLLAGRPVRAIQTYLRQISFHEDIPRIIPDGIYGEATTRAVAAFQRGHNLPASGQVDEETWNAVVSVFTGYERKNAPPNPGHIFPSPRYVIGEGDSCPCLCIVQHMLAALCGRFSNLPGVECTGVCDGRTRECVRAVQRAAGLEPHGNIDKETWNSIGALYQAFVNVFPRAKSAEKTK